MTLLSRAVRNARLMVRGAEWGSESAIPPNSQASAFAGLGQAGSEGAALAITAVLACVKALYDDMSIMPFAAYQGDRDAAHTRLRNQPPVMLEPFGPDVSPGTGVGQLTLSRAMRGNAYMFVVSTDPDTDLPDQFIVLHPDLVKPTRDRFTGQKVFKIGAETYLPFSLLGGDKAKIIHIPGMTMPGSVAGVDVITAQRLNLTIAAEVAEYAHGFFGSGGSPSGVVSVPGSGDRTKAREVSDIWAAAHGGVSNAHKPAIMFGGATWNAMSVTPENAQFLATRKMLREDICGMFSVPLLRIQAIIDNASQGGGAGIEAIDGGYVQHGLMPHGSAIEWVFSRCIPGAGKSWAMFGYDEFLRADAKTRAQVAQIDRVGGIRTRDEIRAERGLPPLPDGQGADPNAPLNSNTSPAGGEDNAPGGPGGPQ